MSHQEEDPFSIFAQTSKRPAPAPLQDSSLPAKKHHDEQASESEGEDHSKRMEAIDITVEREEEGCLHQVYYPSVCERNCYSGPLQAKKYPFKLDPFQVKAVTAIQSDESVLVCAHTSAGKTAVAEYAIALSLKNNSRVIYTSPIKALSNQKYRELKEEFQDVGLVTGDVAIDQGATCLVMTTEILRNMIYRGSEIVREVKWVIFDEVHYMRDKERGVVWEETIIMLPPSVKYVFLSATIGNPGQFAKWIATLRKEPCHVVYTDYRPVPLQHFLCPAGGQGLFLAVDDKGQFHQDNFAKAMQSLPGTAAPIGLDRKKKTLSQGSDLSKIIKVIVERSLQPVIVFSFSKKDVQSYARSICQKYDLTTSAEKERIETVYARSLQVIDETDRKLPAIEAMREIVKKGVGIHHGGLLPLVKEVVQLLFQDGLIKVLFSTETFSMGLNMPARTVVFTNIKKFDGEKSRWITGGEYIQMSGRAGRRGLDKKGTTVLMFDEKMEPDVASSILKGHSDDLLSSFYISYHMLLNSQRMEDIDLEYILARSLLQFQHDQQLPALKAELAQKKQQLAQTQFEQQKDMETLLQLKDRLTADQQALRKISFVPQKVLPYLNIGRIIRLIDIESGTDWGWGLSINFHKKEGRKSKGQETLYLVDCAVYVQARTDSTAPLQPARSYKQEGQLVILSFNLGCIVEISSLKISNMPTDLTSSASKQLLIKTMTSVTSKEVKLLSLECNQPEALKLKEKVANAEAEIQGLKHLEGKLQEYRAKRCLHEEVRVLGRRIKEKSGLVLGQKMRAFRRVMKRTGLVEHGVVTLKGRVTCEINSNHEILLADLIFTGFFSDMTPQQVAAVLSSLVHEERSSTERMRTKDPKLRTKLSELVQRAKALFAIFQECKIGMEEDEYIDSIKEQLVEVTLDWCEGCDFQGLCKKTDTYEGSIIRTLRRLSELLRDMAKAAREIGNQELSAKFTAGEELVFRGIVVAASLYVL